MEILVATGNKGKLAEYQELLADSPITFLSLHDVGLGDMDVAETADTYEGNAILKARAYAEASGKPTLADDSGLSVDALDGAPGVYSARYAGEGASDADRRAKLLANLTDVPPADRTARFECVIAFVDAEGEILTTRGVCEGRIAQEVSDGKHGFGYDPLFIPDGYEVTFGDMDGATKHQLSHRGRAVQALREILKARL